VKFWSWLYESLVVRFRLGLTYSTRLDLSDTICRPLTKKYKN